MHNVIDKIYYRRPRGPKSAGPVAIATFATIVNPALTVSRVTKGSMALLKVCAWPVV